MRPVTVYAYDLDGVLAEAPPASPKAWRRMSGVERTQHQQRTIAHYAVAAVLYRPPPGQRFHVITARKQTTRDVTGAWLLRAFGPGVVQLWMLEEGRTIENVVRFKADVLRRVGATDYAEDNRTVVRELRKLDLPCRIWHFKKGRMVLDYDAPAAAGSSSP